MDGAGVNIFQAAVRDAIRCGSSRLDHDDVTHLIDIKAGAPGTADIDLTPTRVVWRLDLATAHEIDIDLDVAGQKDGAGHNYIDIRTPAPTLVVSHDEYVDITYPWEQPPNTHTPMKQPH